MIDQNRYVNIDSVTITDYSPITDQYAVDDDNADFRILVDGDFRITTDGKYRTTID